MRSSSTPKRALRTWCGALLFPLLLVAPAGFAQDSPAARRALATAIVQNSVAEQMTVQTSEALLIGLRDQIAAKAAAEGKRVNRAAWEAYEAATRRMVSEMLRQQAPILIDVFAAEMTLAELQVLQEFYERPEMIAVMSKIPAINQAVMARLGPDLVQIQLELERQIPANLLE
ncbi:MAG: hypothetical protein AAGE18_03610 [Pseudomonadota bacterium]